MANLQELKRAANAGRAVSAQQADPVTHRVQLLEKRKSMLAAGASTALTVEREIQAAVNMLANSKDLQTATPDSFYTAVLNAINSGVGLCNGRGFLTAEQGECKFVPGWKGLIDLVARTGRATAWTGVVYKGDKFDYELGDSPYLRHRPEGDSDDWADATHVYAIGRIKGQDYPIITVWTVRKVSRHLDKYNTVGDRHYAHKNDTNMEMYARKVVLLQTIKYLPSSQDLDAAVAADQPAENNRDVVLDAAFVDVQGYETLDPAGQHGAQDQTQQASAADTRTPVQKLAHRLSTLRDIAMLDVEADLIKEITNDPGEQADLRNVYRARRATLAGDTDGAQATADKTLARQENTPQATEPKRSTARRRPDMSIE